jgi:hypothetical protein
MDLSPENFERLLNWLHEDREEAGKEYERIRGLLRKHFQAHGCSFPEKLADATIDRVANTLTPDEIANWVGPKVKKFYRVGYYILLEARDNALAEMQIPDRLEVGKPDEEIELEPKLRCLEKCLGKLSTGNRYLIVQYYRGTKAMKIRNREKLAAELKLNLPVLRVQASRIRKKLRPCIERCLKTA